MLKKADSKDVYENLVESYIKARNRAGESILEMANICLKAKTQLGTKQWPEWLKDSRINIKKSQGMKFIAVAKNFTEGLQSTGFLNQKGIEEAYLLTRVKDDSIREEVAEEIIDADFTVKQTREVVKKVEKDKIPIKQAVEEVKNQIIIKKPKVEKKTIPKEDYDKLKQEYDSLVAEKLELEELIQQLQKVKPCECNDKSCSSKPETQPLDISNKLDIPDEYLNEEGHLIKPIKTALSEGTKNAERLSVVAKGWELPVVPAHHNMDKYTSKDLIFAAINGAKTKFNLDL